MPPSAFLTTCRGAANSNVLMSPASNCSWMAVRTSFLLLWQRSFSLIGLWFGSINLILNSMWRLFSPFMSLGVAALYKCVAVLGILMCLSYRMLLVKLSLRLLLGHIDTRLIDYWLAIYPVSASSLC